MVGSPGVGKKARTLMARNMNYGFLLSVEELYVLVAAGALLAIR